MFVIYLFVFVIVLCLFLMIVPLVNEYNRKILAMEQEIENVRKLPKN